MLMAGTGSFSYHKSKVAKCFYPFEHVIIIYLTSFGKLHNKTFS